MKTQPIDALALHAARLSRRRSLLTLGGALIAATTASVEPGSARNKHNSNRKNNNKNKKNGQKGKGADCQEREQQRCSADAAACQATAQFLCDVENVEVAQCLAVRTCCEECSAGGLLTCLRAAQPS